MKKTIIVPLVLFFLLSQAVLGQSVGLVLSGGGAKGISHIGVIKALEENGIPIDYVGGTSMGAIVGGMYAIGLSPEEMLYIIKSEEFLSWYKGVPEKRFETFIYRSEPTPEMLKINISPKITKSGEKDGMKLSLPTSLVSPYPMDIAVVQLFASAAAVADYDFSKLMVPFFCVAADIVKKEPYQAHRGDLGSSIRASMTFPGYFKPITIDSTLLFDGGFYNNFPWEIMRDKYKPDVILGVKCVKGEGISPTEDDPIKMAEAMMTVNTDYVLPENEGVLISGIYDYAIMDFDKADEIAEMGYQNALKYIPQLKERIRRESDRDKLASRRLAFRVRCPELRFNKIEIDGNLSEKEKEYISQTISQNKETFNFTQAKRGYYRVVASNTVNTFYPSAVVNEDSLFTFKLRASKKNFVSLSFGGNVSSSSLNQGYIGLSHVRIGERPWRASASVNIGQYYTGAHLSWRQDLLIHPLMYYDLQFTSHRFDYFTSSQSILISNSLSSYIQENETFVMFNAGMPISKRSSTVLEVGIAVSSNKYNYFNTKNFSKYDKPDVTKLRIISPRIVVKEDALNYLMYPTRGRRQKVEVRYIFSNESYRPGTMSDEKEPFSGVDRNTFRIRTILERYFGISSWFSFGYYADLSLSSNHDLNDYQSTLLMMPAFQPTPHSGTLMLGGYRAPVFLGVALSPILMIAPSLYIHTTAGYFQPYREIQELGDGKYQYSEPFPRGSFMANAAFVWQSPIGPISLSCSYYDNTETKWYPQFNIGFLIFKDRAIRN